MRTNRAHWELAEIYSTSAGDCAPTGRGCLRVWPGADCRQQTRNRLAQLGRGFLRALMSASLGLAILILPVAAAEAADVPFPWRVSEPGWRYEFPRDHFLHPEFKTEWWYFTGNLGASDGRRFGYQLTFFRQGIRPRSLVEKIASRFVIEDFKFAHFAVSDLTGKAFHGTQKTSRGAFGEAGFGDVGAERIAWIDNWTLRRHVDGFAISASHDGAAIELTLEPKKPWVIHGENGISQKAAGAGHASHYYSGTRLATRGTLRLEARAYSVNGETWFDHEWATNQLTPEQVGWDWFSLQFDDGSELMLYQMRLRTGGIDPVSSGTFIAADGRATHLRREDYELVAEKFWLSSESGARYPVAWRVRIPSLDLEARTSTPLERQELVLTPISYWEGAIDVEGKRAGRPISGRGYMELTGYAGPIVGLAK
ncbi:MAG: lipocalin-like domain-containing protein [Chthoniobacteraceae bacterium]